MWLNMIVRQRIKCWLILWIVYNWININVLFWFLNACIIKRDFSNTFSVLECLFLFTNRELKIRISIDTYFLLIDTNTSFFSSSTISFARDAMNERSIIKILSIKLMYTINARNFVDRSCFRLISAVSIAKTIVWFNLIDRWEVRFVSSMNSMFETTFN